MIIEIVWRRRGRRKKEEEEDDSYIPCVFKVRTFPCTPPMKWYEAREVAKERIRCRYRGSLIDVLGRVVDSVNIFTEFGRMISPMIVEADDGAAEVSATCCVTCAGYRSYTVWIRLTSFDGYPDRVYSLLDRGVLNENFRVDARVARGAYSKIAVVYDPDKVSYVRPPTLREAYTLMMDPPRIRELFADNLGEKLVEDWNNTRIVELIEKYAAKPKKK